MLVFDGKHSHLSDSQQKIAVVSFRSYLLTAQHFDCGCHLQYKRKTYITQYICYAIHTLRNRYAIHTLHNTYAIHKVRNTYEIHMYHIRNQYAMYSLPFFKSSPQFMGADREYVLRLFAVCRASRKSLLWIWHEQ